MHFSEFWQGILINAVYSLLVAGAGIVIGKLKAKGSYLLSPLLYGFIGSVLMALLILAVNVQYRLITEQESITTTDNIQAKVRDWLENFHYNIRSEPTDEVYFRYVITEENSGNKIIIVRPKDKSHYLILSAQLTPNNIKEQKIFNKLTLSQREEVFNQVLIEIARRTIGSHIDSARNSTYIEKRIPITPELTENTLIESLDYMDSTMLIIQETITNTLRHYKLV